MLEPQGKANQVGGGENTISKETKQNKSGGKHGCTGDGNVSAYLHQCKMNDRGS